MHGGANAPLKLLQPCSFDRPTPPSLPLRVHLRAQTTTMDASDKEKALAQVTSAESPTTPTSPDRLSDTTNLSDADDALRATKDDNALSVEPPDLTPATFQRLLRKIDWHIMPIMCTIYGLNYLDKTTLSYASVMGLQHDLHLTKHNYQWLGSIFYFGYLFFEYPTNRLLQRLPLAKYTAFNVVMWGVVLCCTAATESFGGIATVRFVLGMFEATVTPAFVLFTSMWYTKGEQGTRTGIWFSFNGFANVLGGLIAYGVARGTKAHGAEIAAWKVVFLVWGLVTVVVGVLFWWLMPDSPVTAWFLSKGERRMALERTRGNQQGRCEVIHIDSRSTLLFYTWTIAADELAQELETRSLRCTNSR